MQAVPASVDVFFYIGKKCPGFTSINAISILILEVSPGICSTVFFFLSRDGMIAGWEGILTQIFTL